MNPRASTGLTTVCNSSERLSDHLRQIVPTVSEIREDHFQPLIVVSQCAKYLQDQNRPIVILDIRGMYNHCQKEAERIHNEVSLSPVDSLGGGVVSFATDFGRFGTLTVNDRRAGQLLASVAELSLVPQRVASSSLHPIVAPLEENAVNDFPTGEIAGQEPPSTTAAENVKDCIDSSTSIDRSRCTMLGWR